MYMVNVNGLALDSLHSHDLDLKIDTTLSPKIYFLIDDIINYIEMVKIIWILKLRLLCIAHNSFIWAPIEEFQSLKL